MKKILFIFSLLLIYTKLNAQTFEKNFLGEDYDLYKNVLLIVDPSSNSGFYHTFYRKLEDCKPMYGENVLYPSDKSSNMTEKKKLLNKVFKVESIVDIKDEYDISANIIFVLRDTSSKKVIYYKYDPEGISDFPFLTSQITYDLCSKVERITDEFTGEISLHSPRLEPVGLIKLINGVNSQYMLWLEAFGSTVNFHEKGVSLIFEDGTLWEREDASIDVSVDINIDGWIYTSYITLNEDELQLFTTKKIRKFRLYVYDRLVEPTVSNKFNAYVNCIVYSN